MIPPPFRPSDSLSHTFPSSDTSSFKRFDPVANVPKRERIFRLPQRRSFRPRTLGLNVRCGCSIYCQREQIRFFASLSPQAFNPQFFSTRQVLSIKMETVTSATNISSNQLFENVFVLFVYCACACHSGNKKF